MALLRKQLLFSLMMQRDITLYCCRAVAFLQAVLGLKNYSCVFKISLRTENGRKRLYLSTETQQAPQPPVGYRGALAELHLAKPVAVAPQHSYGPPSLLLSATGCWIWLRANH